jgi:hypothetical protein
MTDVIPLFGEKPVATNPVGNADTIAFAQDLLKRACDGEIVSIAAAFVTSEGLPATSWRTGASPVGVLVAGVAMLSYRIAKATDEVNE